MKYRIYKLEDKSVGIGNTDFYRGENFSGEEFTLLRRYSDFNYDSFDDAKRFLLDSGDLIGEFTILPIIICG